MENMIEINNLSKSYGTTQVVKDLNIKIKRDRIHGLLGPNGAGKTTTMRAILGLTPYDSGEIIFSKTTRFGHLLELAPLYEDMYTYEYIEYMGLIQGVNKSDIKERSEYVKEKLDLSTVWLRRIGNLSQGFRQRVAIAQAIIHSPDVVILDEPTNGLDPQTIVEIRELILGLKKNHTIVISSHQLHEMSLICDDITIINQGIVLKSGELRTITDEINSTHTIVLELKEISKDYKQFLKDQKWATKITFEKEQQVQKVIISLSDQIERRPLLVKKAVELDLSVLTIYEQKMSLEQMFIKMTQGKEKI